MATDWQEEFLERCCDSGDGSAMGEGAFAPGPALWVGRREVAHFDDERTLDVRLTKAVIQLRRVELKSDGRTTLRQRTSDWLHIAIRSEGDAEWARRIVLDAVEANLPTAAPGLPPVGADLERRRRFH